MNIETYTVGLIGTNCYFISESIDSDAVLVIDPAAEPDVLTEALNGRKVLAYLLTHGHFDHTGALKDMPKAPIYIHKNDMAMMNDPFLNAGELAGDHDKRPEPDMPICEEGNLLIPGFPIPVRVILTPGHTPGSVTYKIGNALFTGDTLFCNGFGRTDLPGGDSGREWMSIRKLFAFADDHTVYPGHGISTTLFEEKDRS